MRRLKTDEGGGWEARYYQTLAQLTYNKLLQSFCTHSHGSMVAEYNPLCILL